METFANNILNMYRMTRFVFDRVENIVGKGEHVVYQHLCHFPRSDQKHFASRSLTLFQMANFRLVQIEGVCTTILNLMKMAEHSPSR